MPFWLTWFFIGAFVTGAAAYSAQHANPAAYNPPTTHVVEQGDRAAN